MDKNEIALEQLKNGIIEYVKVVLDKGKYDKTVTALVKKANSNGTYNITINKVDYMNIPTIGGTCKKNETVRVLVPQSNYSNMVILKGNSESSSGGGGGGGSVIEWETIDIDFSEFFDE